MQVSCSFVESAGVEEFDIPKTRRCAADEVFNQVHRHDVVISRFNPRNTISRLEANMFGVSDAAHGQEVRS